MKDLLGIIILPSSNHHNCNNEEGMLTLISFYLALNIIITLIFLIRLCTYFYKKSKNKLGHWDTFYNYCFVDINIPIFLFCIMNGLALLTLISTIIFNLIK